MNQETSSERSALDFPSKEGELDNSDSTSRSADNIDASQASDALPLQAVDRDGQKTAVRKRRRWRGWIALIIGVVFALSWLLREKWIDKLPFDLPIGQPTPSEVVIPAKIESVFALGRLEPEGEVIAVAGPSGTGDARIESLLVAVGDTVQKGQGLAFLDSRDRLASALKVAEVQVELAERKLAQTRLVVRTTHDQLAANLNSQKAQLKTSQYDLKRQQQLIRSSATSQQELDNAMLIVETAQAAVAEVEARLARYSDDVDESIDVAVAISEVAMTKASLAETNVMLEQASIRAPISGTILHLDLRSGERAGQSTLLRMGRTDAMMVRVEVYESDIAKIKTGQSVKVHAAAFEQPLSGTVESVATFVQRQSIIDADPAANTDARVVEVWVRLDSESSDRAARFVSMQVRVEIVL